MFDYFFVCFNVFNSLANIIVQRRAGFSLFSFQRELYITPGLQIFKQVHAYFYTHNQVTRTLCILCSICDCCHHSMFYFCIFKSRTNAVKIRSLVTHSSIFLSFRFISIPNDSSSVLRVCYFSLCFVPRLYRSSDNFPLFLMAFIIFNYHVALRASLRLE